MGAEGLTTNAIRAHAGALKLDGKMFDAPHLKAPCQLLGKVCPLDRSNKQSPATARYDAGPVRFSPKLLQSQYFNAGSENFDFGDSAIFPNVFRRFCENFSCIIQ
ncbi:hypothetical protein NT2_09_00750 [Caenibius tardaugens NBRC 16725]|uniref:Uncharacterized protein n=1 Tax=Caenibius tardaugens NBRC 16725 TaxID=1219035 RepID=U2YPA0_9SPHN|nr:hypothetical protein [Caenibius tardaugens]AZI35438.1 hypothetical protein EGO55_05250 [Caenibius tardaugens NBRC 16725]GAD50467.1 hypothetical protein NT2_09_00750 [Caenibius tardaugens NBRC 16725]